jgi:Uma2 family endonuclease
MTQMSSLLRPPSSASLPALEAGDHLDQKTFHERYEAMPEDFRAELIGGIVFVPSPLKRPHGRAHVLLSHWLAAYEIATPGTLVFDSATTILDPQAEPQPDLCMLIANPLHGQTREKDEYIVGAPELIVEVASSSESIDLHRKRDDYERTGVKEYLVALLRQERIAWFIRRNAHFEELPAAGDGVFRSEVFPGLWLDATALLYQDHRRLLDVLQQGLATPDHAQFVARLASP